MTPYEKKILISSSSHSVSWQKLHNECFLLSADKWVSLQSSQGGIACERIENRQGTRPQFPEKLENCCIKSGKLWQNQVMNISQIVYHKWGLFFWTLNGFSCFLNRFINTHSFSTKLGSHSPINATSNSRFLLWMRNLEITDLSLTTYLMFLKVSEDRNIFICQQFKTDFEKENYVLQRKPAWRKSVLTKKFIQKNQEHAGF